MQPITCPTCGGDQWEEYRVARFDRMTLSTDPRISSPPLGQVEYRYRCAEDGAPMPKE